MKPLTLHPSFLADPIRLLVFVVLIPVFGAGVVLLLIWWLVTLTRTLTVTTDRTILRIGLLSRHTSECRHKDVRNVQIQQSFLQRLFGTGSVSISTSGQGDVEITMAGIRRPDRVKQLIESGR